MCGRGGVARLIRLRSSGVAAAGSQSDERHLRPRRDNTLTRRVSNSGLSAFFCADARSKRHWVRDVVIYFARAALTDRAVGCPLGLLGRMRHGFVRFVTGRLDSFQRKNFRLMTGHALSVFCSCCHRRRVAASSLSWVGVCVQKTSFLLD